VAADGREGECGARVRRRRWRERMVMQIQRTGGIRVGAEGGRAVWEADERGAEKKRSTMFMSRLHSF
jgi:hypothetical protein